MSESGELSEDELRRQFEQRKREMEENPEKYASYSTEILEQLIPGQVRNYSSFFFR